MTPALSAYLLALPLPVRLALLDADTTGAGGLSDRDGRVRVYDMVHEWMRDSVRVAGWAWLPCNPLAIVEHAARLAYPGKSMQCSVRSSTFDDDSYCHTLVEEGPEDEDLYSSDPCLYTAAIKLLEEVVRG